jgi:5-methylcytosine-specific restriction endonuclease McrA
LQKRCINQGVICYTNETLKNMSKIIKAKEYDHPEHHLDKIEEYISEQRYIPAQLADLLLEQSGHRCSVCNEPNYDLHHIDHLENGGMTEYDNLIVLCPNCHRRVHKENIPDPQQLRHYKLKLEISYSLPIIGHLTNEEKALIKELCKVEDSNELILYNRRYHEVISHEDQEEAKRVLRKKIGYLSLEVNGIIVSDYGFCVTLEDGKHVSVNIYIKVTPKGVKWIDYLKKTNRLTLLD